MTAPLNIVVIEDNDSLRKATVAMLTREGHHVNGLISAEDVGDKVFQEKIDIFLIDLNLPGEDGISLSKRIRSSMPLAGIIMVTARNRLDERLTGYESGADIYLTKPVAPEEMLATISSLGRRIKNGSMPKTSPLVISDLTIHAHQFAPREIEVLQLLASGLGYREVAESMNISMSTVQTHVRNLYRKLDVNSRMHAVIRARQLGLLR